MIYKIIGDIDLSFPSGNIKKIWSSMTIQLSPIIPDRGKLTRSLILSSTVS